MMNKHILDSDFSEDLKSGNESAFSALYDCYWEGLFVYVASVLGDKEDTMDIVQDTFVTVWQQREQLTAVKSLKAYIYAIARYKALHYIRLNIQKRDYLESLLDLFQRYEDSPEEMMITDELQGIIDAEVATLPPKMREVFLLSREQQLTHKEIAAKLNISDKTVKKQISNSLKILRTKLGDGPTSTLLFLLFLKGLS